MTTGITYLTWPYPRWIAHRGAGKLAPENTLAAFRVGAQHGYRMFECDVKLSADGVPFLLHDATLERTTNGQGIAGELSWPALAQLDAGRWHSPDYAGEPLATLEAIARFCQQQDCLLNIEIKPTPGLEGRTGAVVASEAARLWRGQPIPPLLSSFQAEALRMARATDPSLPRALLLDTLPEDWLALAAALDCTAVIINHRLLQADLIAAVHARSMRCLAYTVNDAGDAARLWAAGLDGLITDRVDHFRPDLP